MASLFELDTGATVTPEDKGGPRVGIGCKAIVTRATAGTVGIEIRRGDGGNPESFDHSVRSRWFSAEAGVPLTVELAALDLPAFLPDFTPRTYRMRVASGDGEDITVTDGFIATEPYAPAGVS